MTNERAVDAVLYAASSTMPATAPAIMTSPIKIEATSAAPTRNADESCRRRSKSKHLRRNRPVLHVADSVSLWLTAFPRQPQGG